MPVKRRVSKERDVQITAKAFELFEAMKRVRCTCTPEQQGHGCCAGCDRWWDLQSALHLELHCKLWHWPCLRRTWAYGDERQRLLWDALEEASETMAANREHVHGSETVQ